MTAIIEAQRITMELLLEIAERLGISPRPNGDAVIRPSSTAQREDLLAEAADLSAFADEIDRHGEDAIAAGPSLSR
jgi:hypothetical protein